MKIKGRYKIYRQKGPRPGGPSCGHCVKGRHEKCEDDAFIFCNCWRSKHTLAKKDLHQQPKPQNHKRGKVGSKPGTTRKGST